MKTLLFDIEGTTTDIDFVHRVLFPYSLARLESFVRAHSSHSAVEEVRQTLLEERGQSASLSDAIEALKLWIRNDRKIGPLKTLQGEIWREGYLSKAFVSHVYPDVKPAWQQWREQGLSLSIYSSGSVPAQKLLFAHSEQGDLTPYLSNYFDTKVGGKRESSSYLRIATELACQPCDVVFFSDIAEELDAARVAGMSTVHVLRGGGLPSQHRKITSFEHFAP